MKRDGRKQGVYLKWHRRKDEGSVLDVMKGMGGGMEGEETEERRE